LKMIIFILDRGDLQVLMFAEMRKCRKQQPQ
jgi:hypothetical protein